MPQLRYAQTSYLSVLLLSWLLVFLLTRTVLLFFHLADADVGLFDVLRLYGIGLVYDLSFLLYAALPPALYVLLCPARLWRSKGHAIFLHALMGVALFAMLFVAVAEWLFWDEFGVRFNFIAVDYLVYSDEVINNILESYPIYPLLAFLVVLAMAVTVGLKQTLERVLAAPMLRKPRALLCLGALAIVAFIGSGVIDQNFPLGMGGNVFQRELASNGPFQFFAAFRNNELDYQQFYATLPDARAAALLRAELSEPIARFVGSDPLDIRRAIDNPGLERRSNLVLVTIESLSAKYLGTLLGNYQHLGLFDGKDLAILSPRRGMRRHEGALGLSHETKVDSEDPLLRRDIAYYQGASHAFGQHLIAWQPRPAPQALVSQR